jgi:hypothetical protein
MLKHLKTVCFHSVTVAWGYLQAAAGAIASAPWDVVGNVVSDDGVKNAIISMHPPQWVGPALMLMGAVTIAARMRPH